MDGAFLIGRSLFALLFIISGINHLVGPRTMARFVGSRGVPAAFEATLASGVWLVVAGTMLVTGIWIDLAGLMIAAFGLSTAVLVNHFWTDEGEQRQKTMINHLKDLSLAGGGLVIFALYAGFGDDVGLVLTGPLLDL